MIEAVQQENKVTTPLQRKTRAKNYNDENSRVEALPFTIRIVSAGDGLDKAVKIRHEGYARHMPEFAETLKVPEAADFEPDVVVMLAESKLDGSPVGTVRVQVNALRPLSVEQSVVMPPWLQNRTLAEITRLAVTTGRTGRLAKIALVKALFMYCYEQGIDYAIAAGRAPIDRQYDQLLFEDVFPGQGFIPMAHANNVPHRVLAFEMETGRDRWKEANHPMHDFLSNTYHPDINVSVDALVEGAISA